MSAADATKRSNPGIRTVRWDVATIADGSASVASPKMTGFLYSLRYIKDGTTPYEDTVDFTVTNQATGQGVWTQINQTASVIKYPRILGHDVAGVALAALAAAEPLLLNNESILVALANGGDTKTGAFEAVILPLHGDN